MIIFRKFSFYLSIVGIITGIFFVHYITKEGPKSKPIAEPAKNPYDRAVAASGIIEAKDRNIEVSSPVSGLIKDFYVSVGSEVTLGDPLFLIDDRDLRAALKVRQAELDVASAKLDLINDQLSRLEKVKDLRAISVDEINTKRFDQGVAEANVALMEVKVEETLSLIDRLLVVAPKSGVIIQNNIRVGEFFSATGNRPAMVIGNFDEMQVRADIDEQNAANLVVGKNATDLAIPLKFSHIEPFVIPKRSLTGSSQERVDTRVLQVIYTIPKLPNFPLYIGQQVDVFIDATQEVKL